eukprot:maker-scaffold14_size734282-snap-gene-4.10 protein:Tk11304 transcript:maker-scaffold14_size734282-snap-gene-4.10-mRNA-1 annotation:"---NA---"
MSSSMSEKSGSYSSNNDPEHPHPGHNHHHVYHSHHHPLHSSPHHHLPPPNEHDEDMDAEEDDTFEIDEPTSGPPPSKSSFYAMKRDPRATTNYATMPRRPSNQSGSILSGSQGGSVFTHQSATMSRTMRSRDDFHRPAYIQSIETESHDIYVPSVHSVESSSISFPPPPSSLGSLTRGLRGVKAPPVPPLPSSYEGDYNGLYVPPADNDPYPFVPPPRPPMPSDYPETAGHLV